MLYVSEYVTNKECDIDFVCVVVFYELMFCTAVDFAKYCVI